MKCRQSCTKKKNTNSKHTNQVEDQQLFIPHGGELQPRSVRLDFPVFGGEDPHGWLYKVNQFFTFHNTLPQHRLRLVSFHVAGRALVWFRDMDESGLLCGWEEFVKALLIRFGPSSYDDPREQLTRLRQVGSVEEYKTAFETLSNRLRGLSEPYKLSCFFSGLRDDIRLTVRIFNPYNLIQAFGLAKIQEEKSSFHKKTQPRPSFYPHTEPAVTIYQTHPNNSTISSNNTYHKAIVPVQKISQNQMKTRREKGLCYHCDSKWHPGHRCTSPKFVFN